MLEFIAGLAMLTLILWLGYKITGALLSGVIWLCIKLPLALMLIALGTVCCIILILIPIGVKCISLGFKLLIPGI